MAITLAALHRYLVKSCRGDALGVARFDARGLVDDRRLMVVDHTGMFLSQRRVARLAVIAPTLSGGRLDLTAPGHPPITVDLTIRRPRRPVSVWRHRGDGEDLGDPVAAWLGCVLGQAARLVRLPDDVVRPIDPAYATSPSDQTAFTDGFPLLLTSVASLEDLNRKLADPVPMDRFRPNLVIAGAEPFAEDSWRRIRIGALELSVVKPCARCVVTTIDQATAERGDEPLRTLAGFRTVDGAVLFGQNLIHHGAGPISVGDPVTVLDSRSPVWAQGRT